MTSDGPEPAEQAPPTHRVVAEELEQLDRVQHHLTEVVHQTRATDLHFDDDLVELRDEVLEAKAEDVAPLAEQMMRVAAIRAARGESAREVPVDPTSPYFGHLRLDEGGRERDLFIGKRSYINATAGVVIVDWRNAPISALYYRYDEGDDYEETISGQIREGQVAVRRTLSVVDGELQRVSAPQGVFVRKRDGSFREVDRDAAQLRGGQGVALRPKAPAFLSRRQRRKLGRSGRPGVRPDKHLPEISALIDQPQFELMTRDSEGILAITGGAGSGKTTIGLHRVAFLAFQQPKRYRADRMRVLVPGRALASYIHRVLPDLGLPGVVVRTAPDWLRRQRRRALPLLTSQVVDDSGDGAEEAVRRVKKHPAMLKIIDEVAREVLDQVGEEMARALSDRPRADLVLDALQRLRPGAVARQLAGLVDWCKQLGPDGSPRLPGETVAAVEAVVRRLSPGPLTVIHKWAEILTDRERLLRGLTGGEAAPVREDVEQTVLHCLRQSSTLLDALEAAENDDSGRDRSRRRRNRGRNRSDEDNEETTAKAAMGPEDDALLLRLWQVLCGDLSRPGGRRISYAHLMVDEVQDFGAVELKVLLRCCGPSGSVTLAGDPAQRMDFDTSIEGWSSLFGALGLQGVALQPLRIGYRSTAEIQRFARAMLPSGRSDDNPLASRGGAPVEIFSFGDPGEAVVFLADALRDLTRREPLASVALIARFPVQARMYQQALRSAEVAGVRLVAEQDFSFAPGIEVTDIRQVKGLEFDYVVLLDVNQEIYPDTPESRHLLHIAATRAAHQLWVLTTSTQSPILDDVRDQAD